MSRMAGAAGDVGAGERLLPRTVEIGRVLARHGVRHVFTGSSRASPRERARSLRAALEELGPTFAKLGQVMSTRPDLLPPEVVEELSTLQEAVTPLKEAEVVAVMTDELGVPWEDVFDTIDPCPLAAGTIAQVHRATLETGERVVVKVQRPSAEADILRDLGLLTMFAEKAGERPVFSRLVDVRAVIAHLSESLRRELDFREEAASMERLRGILAPYGRIGVPRLHERLSTSRLLVMEEIDGVPIRDAPPGPARREAASELLEAYYRQILGAGFFHADPHPGNLKWSGDRIYLLDFGMVGELDPETRRLLLLVVMAFWKEDAPFLTELVLALGGDQRRSDIDVASLQAELGELIARYRNLTLGQMSLGPVLQSMTESAVRHEVHVPAALTFAGKALAQMQLATAELDPSIDPFAVAGGYVKRSVLEGIRERMDPNALMYEAQKLGLRVNQLFEAVERLAGARAGPRPAVEVRGLERLEAAVRRGARRLALALTASAFVIGAALALTSSEVSATLGWCLGSVGAALAAILLLDLVRRR